VRNQATRFFRLGRKCFIEIEKHVSNRTKKPLAIEHSNIFLSGGIQHVKMEIQTVAKSRGFFVAVLVVANRIRRRTANKIKLSFWCNYNRLLKGRATFLFQGNKYHYFFHTYNATWRNERTVEIPIAKCILQENKGSVLEVGNVLSHYFNVKHDIVDKYERTEGIITQDIVGFQTSKRYDLIISISTLEHVGWDENPDHSAFAGDSEKIPKALSKLCGLLKPNGKIIITVPLGYNPHLDSLLKSGKLSFDKQFFMKRSSRGDRWVEATWDEVKDTGFNMKVPTANAFLVGILEN
jgi:SAM-dependent methyltransferase